MSGVAPGVLDAMAEALCAARRQGSRVAIPHADAALTEDDGYAIQARVGQALGWFAEGGMRVWKLGGAPASGPSTAPVPREALRASPWQAPPAYAVGYGIEAEVAVRLARPLPPTASADEAWACIDTLYAAIELCDRRWVGEAPVSAPLQLADQQFNRAVIVGAAVPRAERPDWAALRVDVHIAGVVVKRQRGGHPFVDPLASLPWLAAHAARHGDGLRAGDIVATGSWTGIDWLRPGQTASVRFDGLGEARFTAPAA
ncbi:MAG: fumarylacetoacetate hydrolase family protein [Rhodocyclaceae bacterium]